MKKTVEYIVADPAGNITILVLTPARRSDYSLIAGRLLQECPRAEQVGFIVSMGEEGLPFMEMCGLEFCGNASRAFAYYTAAQAAPPLEEITVKVSGSEKPLRAWTKVSRGDAARAAGSQSVPDASGTAEEQRQAGPGNAKIEMPVPYDLQAVEIPPGEGLDEAVSGSLVRMEGIFHLVLTGLEATEAGFAHIRRVMYERFAAAGEDVPAFGVMFMDPQTDTMAPVVYVRDVDTTYFEGSCASGSTAAAYARACADLEAGRVPGSYVLRQPAGQLEVEAFAEDGRITGMILSGSMCFSEKTAAEVELPEA